MSKMLVKYLTPGVAVERPIKDENGDILFDSGHELAEEDINDLVKKKIVVVYIDKEDLFRLRGSPDDKTKDEDRLINSLQYKTPLASNVPLILAEATQKAAISAVHSIINDMRSGKPIDTSQSQVVVDDMVMEMMGNRDAMVNLIDIKTFDDYTFSHSVNVCALSVLIAIAMGFTADKIKVFGVGALLHDVGKVEIQDEILNKKGALTDLEFLEMKKHPVFSRAILMKDHKISESSINVAFQHHEKYAGGGYPRGIAKEEIDQFARIAAVADVYDALTSDRIYRPKMEPYKAMKIILSNNGTHFDPEVVKAFVKHMSVYPIESIVRLSSGEIAIVIKSNQHTLIAPIIRIIYDKNGEKVTNKVEVDLSRDNRFICDVLSEKDLH